jgi:hypothetical protein
MIGFAAPASLAHAVKAVATQELREGPVKRRYVTRRRHPGLSSDRCSIGDWHETDIPNATQ